MTDTIAAIATPPGRGGVGIVRISGPDSEVIARQLLGGRCPPPRQADYLAFRDVDGSVIDRGIALFFRSPNSFTGEDVLELHGHGGPVVLDLLLKRIITLGARPARAGEFSERAFLNKKIDLAQAEAIADLIAAESESAAKAAMASLNGEFSYTINELVEELIQLRLHIEAALDFPEEEIDFLADAAIARKLESVSGRLAAVNRSARQGCLLREGMTVVIAGKPNAGKSSLLNRLAGSETAIVTDVPGTTRDLLREHIQIDGLPLHIIDTAGLRESQDQIEQEGIRRAMHAIEHADRLLLVIDDAEQAVDATGALTGFAEQIHSHAGRTLIMNKIDLTGSSPEISEENGSMKIRLSAKTGAGIELLREHLKQCMGFKQPAEGVFIARRRHLTAIANAEQHLQSAELNLHTNQAGELVAEELRLTQQELSSITGEFTSDDLLGRIFADFCIGK
jgi:tRNA modification GTPase